MNHTFKSFIRHYWDACLASSIITIWLLLYSSHGGIGVCPDAFTYLSVANNIINDFSFTDYRGIQMVVFPLGYPFLLACIQLLGFNIITLSGPILNCVLFSGVLFMSSYLFRQMKFYNSVIRLFLLLLICTNSGLLEVYSMLWSETLFLFLLLLFFIFIQRYINQLTIRNLLTVSVIASLLCFVRFAGVTILITGSIIILLNQQLSRKKIIQHLIVFNFIGSSLTIINILYNKSISGTLAGVRQKAIRSVIENLQDMGEVLRYWFPIPSSNTLWTILAGAILVFIAIFFITMGVIKQKQHLHAEFTVAIFFIVYVLFMLTVSSISRFEILNSRLLIPAYISIVLLLTSSAVYLLKRKNIALKSCILVLVLSTYSFAQYHNYQNNSYTWEGVSYSGIPGYTDDYWRYSPMIKFIEQHPDTFNNKIIFSNAIDALYFLSNKLAFPLPHKDIDKEVQKFNKTKSFSVVWFFNAESFDLIQIEQIKKFHTIKASWQFKDGVILGF